MSKKKMDDQQIRDALIELAVRIAVYTIVAAVLRKVFDRVPVRR